MILELEEHFGHTRKPIYGRRLRASCRRGCRLFRAHANFHVHEIFLVHENRSMGEHHKSKRSQIRAAAELDLRAAFEALGWGVVPGEGEASFVVGKGSGAFVVIVRAVAGVARWSALRGLLAEGVLVARGEAERCSGRPLVALVAPSISDELAGSLEEFRERYAQDVAVILLDQQGRFNVLGDGLGGLRPGAGNHLAGLPLPASPGSKKSDPFSELGQWMLKHLFAALVPSGGLELSKDPVKGVSDLARRAGVSPASASRLISELQQRGFVQKKRGALELVRARALLEQWAGAQDPAPIERGAQFLFPAPDALAHMRQVLRRQGEAQAVKVSEGGDVGRAQACLALFSACEELGVSMVRGARVHVYVSQFSKAYLQELGLVEVSSPSEADILLRKPQAPASVFGGQVLNSGVPAADILQCYLDIHRHPSRGEEQAQELLHQMGAALWP